jgi:hypothetical protein
VKAVRYARVDTLFLAGDDHLCGWFDEAEDRIVAPGSAADGDIDLLDFAALMTLRQGGSVMLVEREALPPPGLSAAILGYRADRDPAPTLLILRQCRGVRRCVRPPSARSRSTRQRSSDPP